MTTDNDISAGVIPLNVVSAKKPGHWIVRGMSPFTDMQTIRQCVEKFVGVLDSEIEWSHHRYEGWPHYVVYGDGDMGTVKWPSGVYLFKHKGADQYGNAEKLGDVR